VFCDEYALETSSATTSLRAAASEVEIVLLVAKRFEQIDARCTPRPES
jgi:hypothetical protein